jgi:hypothetical protein
VSPTPTAEGVAKHVSGDVCSMLDSLRHGPPAGGSLSATTHAKGDLVPGPAAGSPFPDPDAPRQLGSPSGSIPGHRRRPIYPKLSK